MEWILPCSFWKCLLWWQVTQFTYYCGRSLAWLKAINRHSIWMSNMTCIYNSRQWFGCLLTFFLTHNFFLLSTKWHCVIYIFFCPGQNIRNLECWSENQFKALCKFLLKRLDEKKNKQQLNFYKKKLPRSLLFSVFNSFPLFLSNSISLQISTPYYICQRKFYLDL